ncbi:MAG: hypothetical protein HY695_31720 [Deltaproteobacteria bacterium]|nr:hypothetical protein [Deltaproteobacteria bacterium]
METMPKTISKTVQRRQIKRLKPHHLEILTRYSQGQHQNMIAKEMGIGEPWLSVIINSPVFQEALEKRFQEREQELIERIAEENSRRLASLEAGMRYGSRCQ